MEFNSLCSSNVDSISQLDKYNLDDFPVIVREHDKLHWFYSPSKYKTFTYTDNLVAKLKEIINSNETEIMVDADTKLRKYILQYQNNPIMSCDKPLMCYEIKYDKLTIHLGENFDDKMIAKLDSIEKL